MSPKYFLSIISSSEIYSSKNIIVITSIMMLVILFTSINLAQAESDCTPPTTGNWIVTSNCTIDGIITAPGNVIISSNAELVIASSGSLEIDTRHDYLKIEYGGGILIKDGGALHLSESMDDADNDSIHDQIDLLPYTYSDEFANNNPIPTFGNIISRGDSAFDIFPKGDKIRLFTNHGGADLSPLLIQMCGYTAISMTSGDDVLVECGSTHIDVHSGKVEATLYDINNNSASTVIATLDGDDSFFFDEQTFTMISNEGTVQISIVPTKISEDSTLTVVELIQNNTISFDPQTSHVAADPQNPDPISVIIDSEPIILDPGDDVFVGTDAPIINALVANDLDDSDGVYSREDTITITFDSETNEPGGKYKVQRKPAINDMFTFTESLGRAYSGWWTAPDTFVITIQCKQCITTSNWYYHCCSSWNNPNTLI